MTKPITPTHKHIRVVGAAIMRDGMILCAQRGPGRSLAGYWEFPGGKLEPGETAPEALVREIHEELSCEIKVGAEVVTASYEYDFGTVELAVYFATILNGEPQCTEHMELRWIHPSTMPELEWTPADTDAVAILTNYSTNS